MDGNRLTQMQRGGELGWTHDATGTVHFRDYFFCYILLRKHCFWKAPVLCPKENRKLFQTDLVQTLLMRSKAKLITFYNQFILMVYFSMLTVRMLIIQ